MAVPWLTNCRSTKPLECLVVDLPGKRPTSSAGYQYLMMIVGDYSRLGWTFFLKQKPDVPAVFASVLDDIGAQGTPSIVEFLRSGNGTEFTKLEIVALLNCHCIRREYTPVDSPKKNGVVERRIVMVLEATMASWLEPPRRFGGVPLPPAGPLSAEACAHARDAINLSERVGDKQVMLSLYRNFYDRAPFSRLLPFLKLRFHHVRRTLNSKPKARACFFLNGGSNHPQDCCKVLLVSDRWSYTRDVTWKNPRDAFVGLLPATLGGDSPPPLLPPPEVPASPGD